MATTTSTSPPSFADPPFVDGTHLSGGGTVRWCFTGRAQGDLSEAAAVAVTRLGTGLGVPIHTVHQVHGAEVEVLGPDDAEAASGRPVSTTEADGIVTAQGGVALGVRTADCAPVLMWGETPDGGAVVGAAHTGWAGLVAGIVESTAESMRGLGAGGLHAVLGPCIGPECYRFGAPELETVAGRFGDRVRSATSDGHAALDLRAAVDAACRLAGVSPVDRPTPPCTACGGGHYSHRARLERERQLSLVWVAS